MVDEFSDFARLPKINRQPADLHEIIRQVAAMFGGIFAEVQIDLALDETVPQPLLLDKEQVKRVFINLFDNAIEAMDKKGRLSVRSTYDPVLRQVRVEVSDSGPGIPDDDREKLFLPHFSTKKKGAGLGLSIVNQIIKEHDGTVSVQNIPAGGAQFTIELPA